MDGLEEAPRVVRSNLLLELYVGIGETLPILLLDYSLLERER
jgi:hypothetical protein